MKDTNRTLTNIFNFLLAAIIFLIPSNLFLKLFESQAYVNGLRVDYLINKLYLSDIFIVFFIIVVLANTKFKSFKPKISRNTWLLLFPTILLLISQFFTYNPIISIWYLIKITLLIAFGFALIKVKRSHLIKENLVRNAILVTLFFQSSIGLYQFFQQKSVYGFLLLGETNLNNYIGVTKSILFGVEKIVPYGTTAHPNVLAGVIVIFLLYLFNNAKKNQHITLYFIHALALLTLVLTQSLSALLALIIGVALIVYRHKTNKTISNTVIVSIFIISFFLSLVGIHQFAKQTNNPSFVRRDYLNYSAQIMANNHLLDGVGLNNFTIKVEEYGMEKNREIVRFVQPAHNIFLLFFAETGVLGLVSLVTLGYLVYSKNRKSDMWWTLFLLPIALFDHYLITLQTGLLLIVFSAVFFTKQTKKPKESILARFMKVAKLKTPIN